MAVSDRFRPESTEYAPGLEKYVSLALPGADVLIMLERQQQQVAAFSDLPEEKLAYRYAPGKWSVKELLGHLIDCERVFMHRALRFARNDLRAQDGFDENSFAVEAQTEARPSGEILKEFEAVRRSSILFFHSLPAAVLTRGGEANGKQVTVRALAFVLAGHTEHHLNVLAERYLIGR